MKGRNHSRTPFCDRYILGVQDSGASPAFPLACIYLYVLLSLHGNFARHFLFASVCGGRGDGCRSFFDPLHDTLGGDRCHSFVAGGPFQGLVIGIGRRYCDLQGRCLSSRHGKCRFADLKSCDRLLHRDLADRLFPAAVSGCRCDRRSPLLDGFHYTFRGDRCHCLVAGGPLDRLVVGARRSGCRFQREGLSPVQGQGGLVQGDLSHGLCDRNLTDSLYSAAVFRGRRDRRGTLRNCLDVTLRVNCGGFSITALPGHGLVVGVGRSSSRRQGEGLVSHQRSCSESASSQAASR